MALDFSNMKQKAQENQQAQEVQESTALDVVQSYDIVADREKMTAELVNSQEVDDIVSTLAVDDLNSIVTFGADVAEGLSRASDVVLESMSMSQLENTSTLLVTLGKIMDKFDIEEIQDDPSFFGKLFNKMEKKLNAILDKYNTMGAEVDKVYVELKGYEREITDANRKLDDIFKANIEYYHQLVRYILAGEQGCGEIQKYLELKREEMATSEDKSIQFEIQSLEQALMLLEQRTHDLRIAENVALQSIPMIKTMEFSNMNLIRKINSAFIITLPVFKQALAQAIMLKRQKVQAEAMSALDAKTNEMLLKNAQNTVAQSKMTAELASGSSVKIETLEATWKTIMTGIDETREIQENARKTRLEDQVRLEQIKKEFNQQYHVPGQS